MNEETFNYMYQLAIIFCIHNDLWDKSDVRAIQDQFVADYVGVGMNEERS